MNPLFDDPWFDGLELDLEPTPKEEGEEDAEQKDPDADQTEVKADVPEANPQIRQRMLFTAVWNAVAALGLDVTVTELADVFSRVETEIRISNLLKQPAARASLKEMITTAERADVLPV